MQIIDAQLHVWEHDHAGRPWDRAAVQGYIEACRRWGHEVSETDTVTHEELIRRMDAVGVDGALLVTFGVYYPLDNSYALEAAAAHPDRFAVVGRLDATAANVVELVSSFAAQAGSVAVRVLALDDDTCARLRAGAFDRLLAATEAQGLALCLYPSRCPSDCERVARAFPDLQIVIDHLGLPQPPVAALAADPFRALPEVLALARFENVAVKLTGAPTLSRERYPFADLWPHLHAVLDAFGPARVMWGTDTTRTGLSYAHELGYLRDTDELSPSEKELVLGGSLRRVFRWPR